MTGRLPWREIALPWKTAHRAATNGQATPTQHAVLEAIIYLLASSQRLNGTYHLGHIAREAGLWTDPDNEVSRHRKRTTGEALVALHDMGAIIYEPSPGWGNPNFIALPKPDPDLLTGPELAAFQRAAQDARNNDTEDDPQRAPQDARKDTDPNPPYRAESEPVARGSGTRSARPRTRASEVLPTVKEEEPDDGPASADAPPAAPGSDGDGEDPRPPIHIALWATATDDPGSDRAIVMILAHLVKHLDHYDRERLAYLITEAHPPDP